MNAVSGSPAPFLIMERWEWITADEETAVPGFAAEIRVNLRNFERQQLLELLQRRAPDVETFPVIAPWIRAWNAYDAGDDGEPVPIPPPSVAGADALGQIESAMSSWLFTQILIGYRGGKGSKSSREASAGPQVPGNVPSD